MLSCQICVLRITQVAGLQPLQSVDVKPSVSAASALPSGKPLTICQQLLLQASAP